MLTDLYSKKSNTYNNIKTYCKLIVPLCSNICYSHPIKLPSRRMSSSIESVRTHSILCMCVNQGCKLTVELGDNYCVLMRKSFGLIRVAEKLSISSVWERDSFPWTSEWIHSPGVSAQYLVSIEYHSVSAVATFALQIKIQRMFGTKVSPLIWLSITDVQFQIPYTTITIFIRYCIEFLCNIIFFYTLTAYWYDFRRSSVLLFVYFLFFLVTEYGMSEPFEFLLCSAKNFCCSMGSRKCRRIIRPIRISGRNTNTHIHAYTPQKKSVDVVESEIFEEWAEEWECEWKQEKRTEETNNTKSHFETGNDDPCVFELQLCFHIWINIFTAFIRNKEPNFVYV